MNGGVLDSDNRRYDEILNPLVEEENQMRQEGFKKLNLPEEELLKTETNRDVFPENNKPAEPNIKIDKEAVSGTLKTAGRGISSGAKKVFAKVSEFRRRQVERRRESSGGEEGHGNGVVSGSELSGMVSGSELSGVVSGSELSGMVSGSELSGVVSGSGSNGSTNGGESNGSASASNATNENNTTNAAATNDDTPNDTPRIPPPLSSHAESGVTHLKDLLRKESQLKTIEELKKPELASYPIMAPKTAEAIQKNEEDNVEEEIKEIKKIVEPGVSVAKDLPQPKEDPYVAPASLKPANWARRHGAAAWKATKTSSARAWGQLKESGVATQVVLSVVGAGGGGRVSSDT